MSRASSWASEKRCADSCFGASARCLTTWSAAWHLLKTGLITVVAGLPPVLPIVLYNGNARWTASEDIFEMIRPEPPAFLRVYQPHLRYCLIDEGRYTAAELNARSTPLSGIFQIEQSADPAAMQRAVDRIVALIQAAPNKPRIDRIVTRWLKRHLYRQNAGSADARIDLEQLNSLTEDRAMLAENMEAWIRKEREQGIEQGIEQGELMGERKALRRILIRRFGPLPSELERRLDEASSDELTRWSDAILDAPTLEAVFNAPH